MSVDDDFIWCKDHTYVARRLVAPMEYAYEPDEDYEAGRHVLYDVHGMEIGRAILSFDKPPTVIPASGWTFWRLKFDARDPDGGWTREPTPVIAWRVSSTKREPIGLSEGELPYQNFVYPGADTFSYFDETREGRRRYWAFFREVLHGFEDVGGLDRAVRCFVNEVHTANLQSGEY